MLEPPATSPDATPASLQPVGPERERPLRLFVIAGEKSGDMHGANLLRALRRLRPDFELRGLGGPELEAAGMQLDRNMLEDLAIIGFIPVLLNIRTIAALFKKTEQTLREWKPDALLLIDYPGFNIRIAEKAKALGIPVIWYVSPQIWAWHKSRLYTLARLVDKMLVVFPFEEGLYREENVNVDFVGHPLFDLIQINETREQVCADLGLDSSRPLISLVPGSRKKEVGTFLSIMLEGAQRYRERDPDAQFLIIRASSISDELIRGIIDRAALNFEPVIVDHNRFNVRNACDFSWVKSGTSTLEAAILGRPMLIVYRVNYMTWAIGKQLFTIGHIGLPNIVAGDRIVPELLQDEFTPLNLAEKTAYYLSNPDAYRRMVLDLQRVRDRLGGPGASVKAAKAVLEVCGVEPTVKEGS